MVTPMKTLYHRVIEEAVIKDESHYSWYRYTSNKPMHVDFRGKPVTLKQGEIFGLRPSSNGKSIRLVVKSLGVNRVITIDEDERKSLESKSTGIKGGEADTELTDEYWEE